MIQFLTRLAKSFVEILSVRFTYNHGVQRRMVLVDKFFDFFGTKCFCLLVATCDLVHNVETIFHLP